MIKWPNQNKKYTSIPYYWIILVMFLAINIRHDSSSIIFHFYFFLLYPQYEDFFYVIP